METVATNLDGKNFRIILNDGPGAAVDTNTLFHFHQDGEIAHAEYFGGGVIIGRLLGLVRGATMVHRYCQVNQQGELQAGQSTVQIEHTASGKLRLIDSWTWDDGRGSGHCLFEEV